MKKITLLMLFVFMASTVSAEPLESIENYLKKNSFKNPIVKLNTYDQCSGFILMLVNESKHKPLPEKFNFLIQNGYVDITKATIYLIEHNFKNPANIEAKEEVNMDKFVKLYIKYTYDLDASGKNKFDDELINSDLKSCTKIIKEAKK